MKENKIKWDKSLDFIERRFLNNDHFHSTAAVVAKISGDDIYNGMPYFEFHISDCSRTITLDMDSHDMEGIENSIYKMQQIIETATLMKENIEKTKPYIKEYLAEKERKKKEMNKDN